MGYTPLSQRWFYATNHPRTDATPEDTKKHAAHDANEEADRGRPTVANNVAHRSPSKEEPRVTSMKAEQAVTYQPFSLGDQEALERAYNEAVSAKHARVEKEASTNSLHSASQDLAVLKTSESLPADTGVVYVREDLLFDVDLHQMVIRPAYWSGPHFDVRRSGWFLQAESARFVPCDRILTQQLEDGYRKHRMWETTSATTTPPTNESAIEKQWTLFGKYASASVEYASASEAFLYFDDFASKMAKVMTSMWNRRSGGVRLVRGWENLPAGARQSATAISAETPSPQKGQSQNPTDETRAPDTDDYKDQSEVRPNMNEISHLLLVVHGIGQKMSEKHEHLNFIHDVNKFRQNVKRTAKAWNDIPTGPSSSPSKAAPPPGNSTPSASTSPASTSPSKGNLTRSPSQHTFAGASKIILPSTSGMMILPIMWRQGVKLKFDKSHSEDPDAVTTLEDVSLDTIPAFRGFVSDCFLDILLYTMPEHRQVMVKSLIHEMNKSYNLFVKRHPEFLRNGGKVSIFGHSLGSVLMFDILCHQSILHLPPDDPIRSPTSKKNGTSRDASGVAYDALTFDVHNFFAVGSPLGFFLTVTGVRLGCLDESEKEMMTVCSDPHNVQQRIGAPRLKNLYHLYHPNDPVAYRLEPMIHRTLAKEKPASVPYTKGGLRGLQVGFSDLATGVSMKTSTAFEQFRKGLLPENLFTASHRSKKATLGDVPPAETVLSSAESAKQPDGNSRVFKNLTGWFQASSSPSAIPDITISSEKNKDPTESTSPVEQEHSLIVTPQHILERLNGRHGRLDFAIQGGVLDSQYLSMMTSHFSYWEDSCSAFFVLREIHDQ